MASAAREYFEMIRTLEGQVGSLYRRLSKVVPEPASSLFLRLAAEEDSHARSAELALRLVTRSKAKVEISAKAMEEAKRFGAAVADAIAHLDAGRRIGPKQALELAGRIEAVGAEAMAAEGILTDSEEVSRTMALLLRADLEHGKKLSEALQEAPFRD